MLYVLGNGDFLHIGFIHKGIVIDTHNIVLFIVVGDI